MKMVRAGQPAQIRELDSEFKSDFTVSFEIGECSPKRSDKDMAWEARGRKNLGKLMSDIYKNNSSLEAEDNTEITPI